MCGAARGQEACRAGLGSPVTACGTILPVRRSHSRWGNTWFLFPKKVTSGKKDCFLQKGIKTMLIKHCACLSALAQCTLLIQRLQRWLWDRFHLWCHLDDFARNTAGWRCRKLANLLQQTCTQDAKQPRCTVSSSSSSQWMDQASLWVTPSLMPHSAHCLSTWPSSLHIIWCACQRGTNKIQPAWPMLHPTHPVALIFSPSQTFHYLKQRKKQSACLMPWGKHADPSAKADREHDESQTGSSGRQENFAASFFVLAFFSPLKHSAKPTQIIQQPGGGQNSGICKGTDIEQRDSLETDSHQELVFSISVCPAAVSEVQRCLQTCSHRPCTTAQLFQGDEEVIRSLHCFSQTLSLLSSFSVDVPSVVF